MAHRGTALVEKVPTLIGRAAEGHLVIIIARVVREGLDLILRRKGSLPLLC